VSASTCEGCWQRSKRQHQLKQSTLSWPDWREQAAATDALQQVSDSASSAALPTADGVKTAVDEVRTDARNQYPYGASR
jgi:hypothetical protein